jgi:FtsP/CotA-like multicopper oxidase with cupredoxin domain
MLGAGEPLRVREGQRVLFRFLNASATDEIRLALPGHRFNVIAMDGNPVPKPQTVDFLYLDIGERIDALVEMNNPGIWILGSIKDEERMMGMGVVVEYANKSGEPQWRQPPNPGRGPWDYTPFAADRTAPQPDHQIEMKFGKIPGNRVDFNHWTINGKGFPENGKIRLEKGKRYRLLFNNDTGDIHPLHLHRHTFEITQIGDKPTAGLMKDVISVARRSTAAIDFVADNPGLTLFHCHMQLHMDYGFMQLFEYAG